MVVHTGILRFIFILGIVCCLQSCSSTPKYTYSKTKTHSDTSKDAKLREIIVTLGRELIGTPYRKGGKTEKGFDCSGLVIYVCGRMDIDLASCAADQAKCGKTVSLDHAKPGDLIYFGQKGHIHHVGIISVNQKSNLSIIHSSSSQGVIEENILKSDYWIKRIKLIKDLSSYPMDKRISQN